MTAEAEVRCKADPVPLGEAMRAAVDTAATRPQQRHPQVQLARLPVWSRHRAGAAKELAELIICFAEASAALLSQR
jgi:hypothetical protein